MKKVDKTHVKFPMAVFETFAGIGAQHKAISKIDHNGQYFQIAKTSEWDARAIIAYSQIHHQKEFKNKLNEINNQSEDWVDKQLKNLTFSLDSKNIANVIRKDFNFKANLLAANIVNNNNPDITKVKGTELEGIDLITYSFPCQGLSIANMGRDLGIKITEKSSSNLIWQIRRILLEAQDKNIKLPKYLLMENVKNLLSKKHKPDYEKWLAFLKSIGYHTNTMIVDALDHGSLQKRQRVFALSILNPKHKLSDREFKKRFQSKYLKKLNIDERQNKYKSIINFDYDKCEYLDATPNNTDSRKKMAKLNVDLLKNLNWYKDEEWTFKTLTTKQDRHPNIGMVELNDEFRKNKKLNKRFITPREAYKIMGFEDKDFDAVKEKYNEKIITKESLYRQAGNSIVVDVLKDIFSLVKEIEVGYE